jgi:hypothetical protein
MGADLYFFEPGQTEIKVEQVTGFMTKESVGYYRDPYNPTSTLKQLELSWWNDVSPLLDGEHMLDAAGAQKFLTMLNEHEATFQTNLAKLPADARAFYVEDLAVLKRLVQRMIDTPGSRLHCSV